MVFILGDSGDNPKYLLFFIAWLLGAALAGYLSDRKGYGNNVGIATGLCLSLAGAVVWLFVPPRENSDWKIKGPWGNERKAR
jgi:MFS family permease